MLVLMVRLWMEHAKGFVAMGSSSTKLPVFSSAPLVMWIMVMEVVFRKHLHHSVSLLNSNKEHHAEILVYWVTILITSQEFVRRVLQVVCCVSVQKLVSSVMWVRFWLVAIVRTLLDAKLRKFSIRVDVRRDARLELLEMETPVKLHVKKKLTSTMVCAIRPAPQAITLLKLVLMTVLIMTYASEFHDCQSKILNNINKINKKI